MRAVAAFASWVLLCEDGLGWRHPGGNLPGPLHAVFETMRLHAVQIADPFHVVKLANFVLDETRRHVQNETCGHRGRKSVPL